MTITYRELKEKLESIPEDHLDDEVTVYDVVEEEYIKVDDLIIADERDDEVLDEGHPFFTINDQE